MHFKSSGLKDKILSSHRRSMSYGVERSRVSPGVVLDGTALKASLLKNERLISIAGPFLQMMHNFVVDSGYRILLTDDEGIILQMVGEREVLKESEVYGVVPGVSLSEKSMGTNAVSLALLENTAIKLHAREHYAVVFHDVSGAAAPIHDEFGRIIGCLSLSTRRETIYPHTMGLVVASVKAIEYQLKNSFSEMRLKEAYKFVSQILNTLEFGVVATDPEGYVRRANQLASQLLRQSLQKIEKQNLADFIENWDKYQLQAKNGESVMDEEILVSKAGVREALNMNVYPLTDGDGVFNGTVLTLRDMKRVFKMVNKYTGMQARYNFEDLIGESDEMRKIIEYCKTISDSPSTVVIQGESGTGKEVIAQSIHNFSSRRDQGFVALNCGAIPESLIESELFGYSEGAFTSAKKGGRPGKFELANGGTLFLDEIGEMPLDMQVKLLRALQERAVTRVGGDKLIPVDVRIIAATNRNLLKESAEGRFRQDLYYRLSVIPVYIPPLRKRPEDIPMLIHFFLNLKSVKLRKHLPDMDNVLFKKLVSYHWPGNVRELENFIEKYVNLDGQLQRLGEIMEPESYEENKDVYGPDNAIEENTFSAQNEPERELKPNRVLPLKQLEINAIKNTIDFCNGNMTHVSQKLGISRNALYQKMKRYGIAY